MKRRKSKSTLLERFIEERIEAYEEPARRGTPRGEPVGLSKEKYRASLLILKNLKQKEIAKEAGVSHALLRKWNTEEAFKDAVRKNLQDFGNYFVGNTVQKHIMGKSAMEEYMRKPLSAMAQTKRPVPDFDQYDDSDVYSTEVISEIYESVQKFTTHVTDSSMATRVMLEYIAAVRPIMGDEAIRSRLKESGIDLDSVIQSVRFQMIGLVKDTLLKKDINDDDRKLAVLWLSVIEKL